MTDLNSVEILLVEDNPRDAELTIRALRKSNLANQLFHVKDGAEAMDFLFSRGKYIDRENASSPKVVFLDLKLPKVDGLEVLRTIKSDHDLKTIPVVILTSSREEKDLVESYKLGVNAYVVKPVNFQQFIDAVKELGAFWAILNEPPPGSVRKTHK